MKFFQEKFGKSEYLRNFAIPNDNKGNAEIAQLVEHNLAKVGVASSSLVFRSLFRHSFFHSIRVSEVVRFLIHFFCQLLTKSNIKKAYPRGTLHRNPRVRHIVPLGYST